MNREPVLRPFDGPRDDGLRHDFSEATGSTRDARYPMATPCANETRGSLPSTVQSALATTEWREEVSDRRVEGQESRVNIVRYELLLCVCVYVYVQG